MGFLYNQKNKDLIKKNDFRACVFNRKNNFIKSSTLESSTPKTEEIFPAKGWYVRVYSKLQTVTSYGTLT